MKIVFARHGETDWNAQRLIQGHHDIPLNDNGRKQAAELAELVVAHRIAHAFCSDLERAHETARIVAEQSGVPTTVDARLRECHYGSLDGQPYSIGRELDAHYPKNHPNWHDPLECDFSELGGETGKALFARQLAALHDIHAKHPDETVLIVGHGRSLRVLLHGIGQSQEHFGNCAHFVVPFDAKDFPL